MVMKLVDFTVRILTMKSNVPMINMMGIACQMVFSGTLANKKIIKRMKVSIIPRASLLPNGKLEMITRSTQINLLKASMRVKKEPLSIKRRECSLIAWLRRNQPRCSSHRALICRVRVNHPPDGEVWWHAKRRVVIIQEIEIIYPEPHRIFFVRLPSRSPGQCAHRRDAYHA